MTGNKIPSPLDIQKEQTKFISKERANKKKCPICFSLMQEEACRPPDDLHCYNCNLTFSQTYLNVFWFGFEVGVDATLTNSKVILFEGDN